jgi:hypothetical protein
VQIKRAEPTTTHIVSDPAACPYCVQDNFGIVYTPPTWRAGIGSDNTMSPQWPDSPKSSHHPVDTAYQPIHKRRQKSFGHDSPEVVTTDNIRPDWEAKLAAVRAAVTRRANRRIIMRQVGDRLIPVGVTSGRVHAISPEEAGQNDNSDNGGSRRLRRQRGQNQDLNHLLGLGGQDLEEIMIMEAMRLSLVEHEEQQRREAANREKNTSSINAPAMSTSNTDAFPSASGSESLPELHPPAAVESSILPPPIAPVPRGAMHPSVGPPFSGEGITARDRSLTPNPGSRNRTPSPIPPPRALQPSSDSSSNWRRRSSSPRTFNTIAAAISAATTATAILADEETSSVPGGDNSSPPSGRCSTPAKNTEAAATSNTSLDMAEISILRDSDDVGTPRRPPIPIQTQSYASSIFSTGSTGQTTRSPYDVLSSSPDSEFAREPLLSSNPITPAIPDAGTGSPKTASSGLAD